MTFRRYPARMQNQPSGESLHFLFVLPNSKELRSLLKRRRPKLKLTALEKAAVLRAVKEQAVATAKFWDVLGELESKYGVEIDSDPREISEFAVGCNYPPSVEDLQKLTLTDVLSLLTVNVVETPDSNLGDAMPSLEQWELYQAIETAQKALKGCTVDRADDHYQPSKRLRLQLGKLQRLLGQMSAESETVMRHVMELELCEKKLLAKTDSDDAD